MKEAEKQPRATAIVEWTQLSAQGVLVYASHKGFWHLPSSSPQRDERGRQESPLVAAVRELSQKTGLETHGAHFLFRHEASKTEHQVFLLRASGALELVNLREALAFGLCAPTMAVTPIMAAPGFFTGRLRLLSTVREIIARYYQLQARHEGPWRRPETGEPPGLALISQ